MVHYLNAKATLKALDVLPLIKALDNAFKEGFKSPVRHHHTVNTFDEQNNKNTDNTLLLMPCWDGKTAIGTKIVTIFPDNADKNLPSVQGLYFLSDGQTGEPIAIMDGQNLTVARTAATSALAASYLAKKTCKTMLMVGTGSLAPHLIRAHNAVQNFDTIYLWGRNFEKAQMIAKELSDTSLNVTAVDDLETAAGKADIITTATLSKSPLIKGDWVKPGTHVDLVGAYRPDMRESDDDLISKAKIFVDTYDGALAEGGDIVQPLTDGIITRDDVLADLYDLCQNKHAGRENDEDITVFKSVGNAIEDFVAAQVAIRGIKL